MVWEWDIYNMATFISRSLHWTHSRTLPLPAPYPPSPSGHHTFCPINLTSIKILLLAWKTSQIFFDCEKFDPLQKWSRIYLVNGVQKNQEGLSDVNLHYKEHPVAVLRQFAATAAGPLWMRLLRRNLVLITFGREPRTLCFCDSLRHGEQNTIRQEKLLRRKAVFFFLLPILRLCVTRWVMTGLLFMPLILALRIESFVVTKLCLVVLWCCIKISAAQLETHDERLTERMHMC